MVVEGVVGWNKLEWVSGARASWLVRLVLGDEECCGGGILGNGSMMVPRFGIRGRERFGDVRHHTTQHNTK